MVSFGELGGYWPSGFNSASIVNGSTVYTNYAVNVPTAIAPAAVSPSTGVNPLETSFQIYGKTIPLSVLGRARIGGMIIVGPWIENGLASFGISFGVPANPNGSRTLTEIAFDSEVVWDSASGFRTEAFTYRFYEGTYTQAIDALESTHFPTTAHAYRPQMMIFFENLPLANTKFQKIPYVAAVIEDDSGTDVNLGEAFERLAASPWVDLDQFETTGVTDALVNGGLIFAEPTEFLSAILNFARFYRTWDVLQTDKLRIVDRGSTVTADITLDKSRLMESVVYTRQEPNSVPSILKLSTIDPDSDYTIIPSIAQRPRVPVAVTTAVRTEDAYLPAVMDASTRQSVVTYAKYAEEQARKKVSFTAMIYGLEIEPGDLVALSDLGDDFTDETFKVIETLHGANYSVEISAEAILKCEVAGSSGGGTPGTGAVWAVSRSRILVPGYAGPLDDIISGLVHTLYDQSGGGRDISGATAAVRPIATTSGPNSRECCDFSPISTAVGHALQTLGTDPMSDFISAGSGYMVVSIRPDVVTQNSTTAHSNASILNWGPFNGIGGLSVRSGGILYAYNNDSGGEDKAASALLAVPIGGNPSVVEWRHEGGNLYQRVNGAGETTVASGNTTDLTDALKMGFGGATGQFYNGKVFEAMIYSTPPTLGERDAIVADMMDWVGA